MTTTTSLFNYVISFSFFAIFITTTVNALGSAATTAVTYGTSTVCGIVAGESNQYIKCYQYGKQIVTPVLPNVSFEAISGGRRFFCGLRTGGFSLHCWDTTSARNFLHPKRLFHSEFVQLTDIAVGDAHVCARELHSGVVRCWRGSGGGDGNNGFEIIKFESFDEGGSQFRSITSGCGFSCGVLKEGGRVVCWGERSVNGSSGGGGEIHMQIQKEFEGFSMSSLVAGVSHVCGFTLDDRVLVCKGNNGSGQLGGSVPYGNSSGSHEFSSLALGEDFTCAIRHRNGEVVCWGGDFFNGFEFGGENNTNNGTNVMMKGVSFESIVAGLDFVCGLTTRNLSVICWGPGWSYGNANNFSISDLPLGMILPGPCGKDDCRSCGTFPNSNFLCHGSGSVCYSCHQIEFPLAVPLLPPTTSQQVPMHNSSSDESKNKATFLAFMIVGSVGAFSGLCTILYFLWIGVRRFLKSKVGSSVQPTTTSNDSDTLVDISSTIIPNPSPNNTMKRHRSGSSSLKHVDKIECFSFFELATATNNFSIDNLIGAGSFGNVYKGKLRGLDVAIKRGDTSTKKKKFQEKETAFDSELALLSRLHHKHLVKLIGFCEEEKNDERLLVYEYMSNGSLHDHLHNSEKKSSSSNLNSWKMRIKIALGAARGIEYIHNYAVPPIIHRDIKSSNILLDLNWNARVSDFGLSLIWPETEEHEHLMLSTTKAVGTVGYIDPEYYVSNVLTTKSDVYGLGVVLLELLTGKRAVFKTKDGSGPIGVVEYAVPKIAVGDVWSVLDSTVGMPEVNEIESLELIAYTAMHCVNLEGKERPEMIDIVANLERALALVGGSPASSPSVTPFYSPF